MWQFVPAIHLLILQSFPCYFFVAFFITFRPLSYFNNNNKKMNQLTMQSMTFSVFTVEHCMEISLSGNANFQMKTKGEHTK